MFHVIEIPVWVFLLAMFCLLVLFMASCWYTFWFAYGKPQGAWVLSRQKVYRRASKDNCCPSFYGYYVPLYIRDPSKKKWADIRIFELPQEPPYDISWFRVNVDCVGNMAFIEVTDKEFSG